MPNTATIGHDINIPPLFDEIEKPGALKFFLENKRTQPEAGFTAGTILKGSNFLFGGRKNYQIPKFSKQNTIASLELSFEDEVVNDMTHELADIQQERFESSFYDEDLLDWDAAIITPPSRPSGTIRVKLKYKERRKPSPFDDYWEE